MKKLAMLLFGLLTALPAPAQTAGKVVEEIVARVNNEIITLSDLQRAHNTAQDEARQECPRCSPEQLQTLWVDKNKNALRDLIDQSLLEQRAKDMGISTETELIKELDQIRKQNQKADMEALEKAVQDQGMNYEDFKNNLRNRLLTNQVVSREVTSRIIVDKNEVQKYYEEHKGEFVRPEQVALREIFVSTEGKPETEIPALEKRANDMLEKIKNGDDVAQIAKPRSKTTRPRNRAGISESSNGASSRKRLKTPFSN